MPRVRSDNDARYALRASFVDGNGDVLEAPIVVPSPSPWTISGSVIHYNSGSVGIGTNTPSGVLAVTDGANGLIVGQLGENFYSGNTHRFFSQNYATEHLHINSSGNVGLGTTGPNLLTWNNALTINTASGNVATEYAINGSAIGYIGVDASTMYVGAYASVPMLFRTGNVERMRIDSNGTLCLGHDDPETNGPSSRLYVCSQSNNVGTSNNTNLPDIFVGASTTAGGVGAGGEIRFGSGLYGTSGFAALKGYITNGTANGNVGHLDLNMRANSSNTSMTRRFRFTYAGDFHADGDVIAYSTTVSDVRLKEDIETIDGALDTVGRLRGTMYTWNAGAREGERDMGVIAQEVEEVIPEIVREKEMALVDGNTYKTVDYEKLTAVLIEAVKELKAEVDALKETR